MDDLFDFDGDGELDSVERMEMYQFMDNTANRDRNSFVEDYDELKYMDPDERREMLEGAELDSDYYKKRL